MKFEQMPINWFLLRAVGDLFLVWVRWAGTEEGGLSLSLPLLVLTSALFLSNIY